MCPVEGFSVSSFKPSAFVAYNNIT